MALRKRLLQVLALTAAALCIAVIVVFNASNGHGWRALSVQTGSMVPVYRPGTLVLVNRVPASQLKVGDVITYSSLENANKTTTHRIVGRVPNDMGPDSFITKGDANKANDPTVDERQILGRVDRGIPYLGYGSDFLRTPAGLATLIYLPSLLIIIYETRLMIKRLLELEELKNPQLPPMTGPAALSQLILPNRPLPVRKGVDGLKRVAFAPHIPGYRPPYETTKRRHWPGIGVVVVATVMFGLIAFTTGATFASLTSPPSTVAGSSITTKARTLRSQSNIQTPPAQIPSPTPHSETNNTAQ